MRVLGSATRESSRARLLCCFKSYMRAVERIEASHGRTEATRAKSRKRNLRSGLLTDTSCPPGMSRTAKLPLIHERPRPIQLEDFLRGSRYRGKIRTGSCERRRSSAANTRIVLVSENTVRPRCPPLSMKDLNRTYSRLIAGSSEKEPRKKRFGYTRCGESVKAYYKIYSQGTRAAKRGRLVL